VIDHWNGTAWPVSSSGATRWPARSRTGSPNSARPTRTRSGAGWAARISAWWRCEATTWNWVTVPQALERDRVGHRGQPEREQRLQRPELGGHDAGCGDRSGGRLQRCQRLDEPARLAERLAVLAADGLRAPRVRQGRQVGCLGVEAPGGQQSAKLAYAGGGASIFVAANLDAVAPEHTT
jgi:hypothetical protein